MLHAVLVLDKSAGMSSASAVEHVRRALRIDRAGHGGTLDPLATGVLPICLGAGTKIAGYLLADDKAYEAEGRLGVETDTLDRTGAIVAEHPVAVDEAALRAALAARTGEHDQVPPMYSAIKRGGVPLYRLARAGAEVPREARRVRIDRLELLAFDPPRFSIAVACSKGTYVRSLVADLGRDLGCGAHLTELRRTRSGRFSLAQAITLDRLAGLAPDELAPHLIPLGRATGLPAIVADAPKVAATRSGIQLQAEVFGEVPPQFQLVDEAHRLVAIAHPTGGRIAYDRVFTAEATS